MLYLLNRTFLLIKMKLLPLILKTTLLLPKVRVLIHEFIFSHIFTSMCFCYLNLYEGVQNKMIALIILDVLLVFSVIALFFYIRLIEQKLIEQFTNFYNLETKFRRIVNDHANIS